MPDAGRGATPRPERRPATPAPIRISVLNGAAVAGLAARTADGLEGRRFKIERVADAAQPATVSSVLYAPGARRQARIVARRLGIDNVTAADPANQAIAGAARVVVIVGSDRAQ